MRQLSVVALPLLVLVLLAATTSAFRMPTAASMRPTTLRLGKHFSAIASKGKAAIAQHLTQHITQNANRGFRAMQSRNQAVCADQAAYDAALANVTSRCPGLSEAFSNESNVPAFVSTYCGSSCYTAVTENLKNEAFEGCGSEQIRGLLEVTQHCVDAPECASGAYFAAQQKIKDTCGNIGAVLDIDNNTSTNSSAAAELTSFCTNCEQLLVETVVTYQNCFADEHEDGDNGENGNGGNSTTQMSTSSGTARRQGEEEHDGPTQGEFMVGLITFLCSKDPAGDLCGIQVRNLQKLNCGHDERTNQGCKQDQGAWCSATTCEPELTSERLNDYCSPCTTGFLEFMASVLDEDPFEMSLGVDLICAKVEDTYCLPYLEASGDEDEADANFDDEVFNETTLTRFCEYPRAECMVEIVGIHAMTAILQSTKHLDRCTKYSVSDSGFEMCFEEFATALHDVATTIETISVLCSTNAAGHYCLDVLTNVTGSVCFSSATAASKTNATTCPAGCEAEVNASLTNGGCCWPILNSYFDTSSGASTADFLPTEDVTVTTYTGQNRTYRPKVREPHRFDRSAQPANNMIGACVPNTTAFWALIETECPLSADAITEDLEVALAFEELDSNPELKERVTKSLVQDTAKNLDILPNQIRGAKIVKNDKVTLQVKSSGARSRRAATTGTASGSKLEFAIDAKDKAATQKASAKFDQKKAAGTLTTTSTASTVKSQCSTCTDTRAGAGGALKLSAPVTPAPPPGVKLTLPPKFAPAKSSATSIAVTLALAFAAVLAMF